MTDEIRERAALTIQSYYLKYLERNLDNMSTELDTAVNETIYKLLGNDPELLRNFLEAYNEDIYREKSSNEEGEEEGEGEGGGEEEEEAEEEEKEEENKEREEEVEEGILI